MDNILFNTANDAFHDLYWRIARNGQDFAGTKALFNLGFYSIFTSLDNNLILLDTFLSIINIISI